MRIFMIYILVMYKWLFTNNDDNNHIVVRIVTTRYYKYQHCTQY